MTTTTFSAPLVLLWVQVRILKWMVVLLLVLFVVSLSLGNSNTEVIMAGSFLALLFIAFLVTLSGPILFGSEFAEGASDYLATRPISPRMVFGIKTAVIMIYCAVCAYLTRTSMGTDAPRFEIVLFPLYLNIALWCAVTTLLTRDTVRGLLFGIVTFIPLMYVLILANTVLFSDPIVDESGRNFTWGNFNGFPFKIGVFTSIYFIFSPLLFLGMLSMANHLCCFQRVGVPLTGKVSFTLLAGFLLFAKAILWCDGSAHVSSYVGGYGVSAARVDDTSLWLLEGRDTAMLTSVSLNGEDRQPIFRAMLPSPENSLINRSLLTEDRVLIVWWENHRRYNRTLLYDISDPNDPTEMGPLSIQDFISRGRYLGNGIFEATITKATETMVVYIDLIDGSSIVNAPDLEKSSQIGSIPTTSPGTYKKGLMAVCPPELGINMIHLIEQPESEGSSLTLINIPFNLLVLEKVYGLQLSFLGFPRRGFHEISLGLAGDYLIAWFEWGRCAIWDVSDPKNPTYLGVAPTPFSFHPITTHYPQISIEMVKSELINAQSEDGSLVFPSNNNGILWLEFPALMKEAKKS